MPLVHTVGHSFATHCFCTFPSFLEMQWELENQDGREKNVGRGQEELNALHLPAPLFESVSSRSNPASTGCIALGKKIGRSTHRSPTPPADQSSGVLKAGNLNERERRGGEVNPFLHPQPVSPIVQCLVGDW